MNWASARRARACPRPTWALGVKHARFVLAGHHCVSNLRLAVGGHKASEIWRLGRGAKNQRRNQLFASGWQAGIVGERYELVQASTERFGDRNPDLRCLAVA